MKNDNYTYVKKDWGSELWLVNNEFYCAKVLTCNNTWSSKGRYHYHKNKDETFIVISGKVILDIGGTERILTQGNSYRIKPGVVHRFKGCPEGEILEVSTTHEDEDSYYVG